MDNTSKIVENSTQNKLYFAKEEENEIAIGVSEVTIGELSDVDTINITKTGGVDLYAVLYKGISVKFDSASVDEVEIRRVESVDSANTFTITKPLLYSHSGQDLFIDFVSNDDIAFNSNVVAGKIQLDNFENSLELSEVSNGIIILSKCTEFTGITSLFIFDDTTTMVDRKESLIIGTYDINNNDEDNVFTPFMIKPNKSVSYIINMEENIEDLDEDNKVTISTMESIIYSIACNGTYLNATQYTRVGNTITVTDTDVLDTYSNYVRILSHPDQRTLPAFSVRFKIQSFDKTFIFDENLLNLDKYFGWKDVMSSQANINFYEYRNREVKQTERIKINQDNTLVFEVKTGIDDENIENIDTNIRAYLDDKEFFRLISYNSDTYKYTYYMGCRIQDGINESEGLDYNKLVYTISYLKKFTLSEHTWGDNDFKWGKFKWGMIGYGGD